MPGRPAAPLSEHYKLDCDYGTPIMALYKTGDGSDAVYLCANHIGEVQVRAPSRNFADVRLIEGEATADRGVSATSTTSTADVSTASPASTESAVSAESAFHLASPEVVAAQSSAPVPAPAGEPVALRSVSNIKAAKMERAATPKPVRAARDLTFGNAAKALVDEAIWNMAAGDFELYRTAIRQGRPPIEAALAAGGQLAIVHRKISEYTIRLEAVLFESKARIGKEEAIDKQFEQATQEIIESDAIGDAEKDAAIEHIGALQESINRGLENEISPLQAHRIACALGERVNWGASAAVAEELKPVYRAIYSSARSALRKSAPHVQILEEKLVNLFAARADLDHAIAAKDSQRLTA